MKRKFLIEIGGIALVSILMMSGVTLSQQVRAPGNGVSLADATELIGSSFGDLVTLPSADHTSGLQSTSCGSTSATAKAAPSSWRRI